MVPTEQLIANYTPTVDISSLIICCLLMYVISKALFFLTDTKFIYVRRSLFFITIGTCCNIWFYLTVVNWPGAIPVLFILRDIYHISFLFSLYCFMLYMKHMIDVKTRLEKLVKIITRHLFCITLVMDLLSPLTRFGFYIENGMWYDSIFSPYNVFYVYAFVMLFLMLVFYSKRIIRNVRLCLGITGLAVAVIMTYQGIANINTYTSFTYVLPVFVVMILLHSKPFDDKTGALSLASLDSYIKKKSESKVIVEYIILKLNISMIDSLPKELGKVLNSFWHDSFKKALTFNLSSDVFVLAVPKNKKNGDVREKINQLVENALYKYHEQFKIPYKLLGLFELEFIENAKDILGITHYLLNTMEENSVLMLNEQQRAELRIMKKVKESLADIERQKDPEDPRVVVYYQPIRNMKTGEFDTAEALMRLNLDEVGFVLPYLFITMAEEYGYINNLTKIMVNKVCKQIKQLEADDFVFKRITINASAVDIKVDGFCEELINIINSNNVSCSKIGIELTESKTESDFMILKEKMKILHDAGIALYLDDVGTGYSNIDRIVQYEVDVVKFDRFFILEAEKSMKIVKMMSHLSQAFQDMEYKLLFEGVETEAHEALCLNCGADYIQGFRYSEPVPVEKLKRYLKYNGETPDMVDYEQEVKTELASIKRDFSYKEMKDQYSILVSMSQLFYSMHVIDLINNTAKPYNPTEDVKVKDVVNSTLGADEMMKQIMCMCTIDEHVPAVLEFTDLSTIADRMINKKILSAEYIGKSIGWYVASFYTIDADDNGRPTKVVFTTRSIDVSKRNS